MAQFYKYIVTIVNQIPQESYICYTNDIAYHLVHILDSHQISNILKLIWLSCLFKFSPSMLMLPCSILRHVWVPKRAKHKVLDKKNSNPCQLLAFETPPGAFSRFNLSNGRGCHPNRAEKEKCHVFFPRLLEEVHRLSLPAGPYWSTKSWGDVNSEKWWKWLQEMMQFMENKQTAMTQTKEFYCHNICMNSINNFQHDRVAKGLWTPW